MGVTVPNSCWQTLQREHPGTRNKRSTKAPLVHRILRPHASKGAASYIHPKRALIFKGTEHQQDPVVLKITGTLRPPPGNHKVHEQLCYGAGRGQPLSRSHCRQERHGARRHAEDAASEAPRHVNESN